MSHVITRNAHWQRVACACFSVLWHAELIDPVHGTKDRVLHVYSWRRALVAVHGASGNLIVERVVVF